MKLKSFDYCPSCSHRIDLSGRNGRHFVCPDCSCEFRHDIRRWFPVATPLAVAVGLMMFEFTHMDTIPGALIKALLVVVLVAGLLTRLPPYAIVKPGKSELKSED
jgi:hypothetical protein